MSKEQCFFRLVYNKKIIAKITFATAMFIFGIMIQSRAIYFIEIKRQRIIIFILITSAKKVALPQRKILLMTL